MTDTQFDRIPHSVLVPYTGGHTIIYGGYVYELCPSHRKANPHGFVPQHRLVVERNLNRYLLSREQIHHIDCNPLNNKIENLQVVSRSEHQRIHRQLEREKKYPPITKHIVQQALAKGGLKLAARELGCHTETIRNQFPDLVQPYKRKSPAKLDDPKWIASLKILAKDPKIGYREAALILGISAESIAHILNRNKIVWTRKSKVGEVHKTYRRRNKKSIL